MQKQQSGPRLPESFYSTYRQSKESTAKILRWVHMTVVGLRERTREITTPSPTGRAQGKRARGFATKRPSPTPLDADITSPKIPLRVFLQYVREIAASDVIIPTVYLVQLEAAIKQRKRTASFYSPDAEAWDQNRSHIFAINAYTEALSILKEAQQKRTETEGGPTENIRDALAIRDGDNIFALSEAVDQLAVMTEDQGYIRPATVAAPENEWLHDNAMLNSPRSGGRSKKSRSFALDEYELVPDDYVESKSKKQKSEENDSFEALRCFLLDVHHMRQFCQQIWRSVIPAGNVTYIAASFVTNKAVQLVKEMEYALIADFPSLGVMNDTFEILLEVLHSQMPNATPHQKYSFEEKIMLHTWETLKGFAEVLDDNPVPILRDGYCGYFDPLADRDSMPFPERYLEERCIMMNHWPDLVLVGRQYSSFIGGQGLGKDFKAFYQSKPRPVTWALIFACQMQADSVFARRRHLKYDLQVMRNLGSTIRNEYDAFLADGVEYCTISTLCSHHVTRYGHSSLCNMFIKLKIGLIRKLRVHFDRSERFF
ncbi:hypothetical protein GALMADRAFT_242282 [Galerina marginata CBS 339.88]|uniref:DUF6604 domain-containing protein n=1 Tax=Galerina marginata (strain CBS 339.88) TaxID=685588 RepID=A0A067TCJ7_GALM3|nr:hypothetical protein GALMADRAFT_242282 [Galerina marginata CBS 339.88]